MPKKSTETFVSISHFFFVVFLKFNNEFVERTYFEKEEGIFS